MEARTLHRGRIKYFQVEQNMGFIVPEVALPNNRDVHFRINGLSVIIERPEALGELVLVGAHSLEAPQPSLRRKPQRDERVLFYIREGRGGFFTDRWTFLDMYNGCQDRLSKRSHPTMIPYRIRHKRAQVERIVWTGTASELVTGYLRSVASGSRTDYVAERQLAHGWQVVGDIEDILLSQGQAA